MQRSRILLLLFLLLLSSTTISLTNAHNITEILASHPDFSTFNHYLTTTHLASQINHRQTITVLAISNSAMSSILSKHLSLSSLKNLLSLHVLVDYFGAKKLHQITGGSAMASTVFQSSGQAQGMAGFVNITDRRAGKVTFRAEGSDLEVSFVKSVKEIPYNISVVQISQPLQSDVAEAPTPSPAEIDFVGIMAKKGCKTYSDLITAGTGEVAKTFEDKVNGSGLTSFCPIDQAMAAFMPKFKNLTQEQKTSVLLYHALPSYNSIEMLKSKNGLATTLATKSMKAKDFNLTVKSEGEVVKLKSRVTVASITGTLVDEDPLAVYTIDEVLEPRELFKAAEKKAEAPAPEPAEAPAEAPKGAKGAKKEKGKKKKKHADAAPAPSSEGPAPGPSDDEDGSLDEVADLNVGRRVGVDGGAVMAVAVAVLMAVVN